jgi:DNA polymerase-3 subunit delta'
MTLLPWQEFDYQQLAYILESHGYPALLLHGSSPELAQILLKKLYAQILCPNPSAPCAVCSSCILFAAGNHPDILGLSADEAEERKTPTIKVEQVRSMLDFVATAPHQSLYKVIHIEDCTELTLSSANALLKILEEAPDYCVFIFYGQNLEGILPTIKSRMLKYKLASPERRVALEYLTLHKVAEPDFYLNYFNGEVVLDPPFSAEQIKLLVENLLYPSIDNLFTLSNELDPKQLGLDNLLDFLLKWLSDLALLNLGGGVQYFARFAQEMQKMMLKLNPAAIYQLVDEIIFLRQWSKHPLNQKLQWENILFKYQQIYSLSGNEK